MIDFDQLRQLIIRADNGYFQLFVLASLVTWAAYAGGRLSRLDERLKSISIPLPTLTLSAILIVAFLLRLPRLSDSLWYDEAFTARITSLPLDALPGAIIGDIHPPLWYLIEWITVRLLGSSELALRLPSLIAGMVLIALVHRLALRLKLGDQVALLSAFLVAIFPAAIYYSNEARAYSFLACLVISMVIAIAEDRPRLFALTGALVCWTHNLGYFYLAILGMYAVWRYRRSLRFTVAFWLAGAVAAIWLPFLLHQSAEIADGFWMSSFEIGSALKVVTDMTIYRSLPEALVVPVYGAAIGLTLSGTYIARRWLRTSDGALFLVVVAAVPLAIAAASVFWHPVYLTRALLPVGVGLALVWANALINARLSGIMRLVAAPALVLALVSFYVPAFGRADVRGFTRFCDGATGVYATSITAAMFAGYYVNAPMLTWIDAGDLNQSLTPEAKAAFHLTSGAITDLGNDVCLFTIETPMLSDHERSYVEALTQTYRTQVSRNPINPFYNVNVYRLDLAGEEAES